MTSSICFLHILAFQVTNIDGIKVTMQGLGQPLNWAVRKILQKLLVRHLPEVLEREAKGVIQQELNNVTTESDTSLMLPMGGLSLLFS